MKNSKAVRWMTGIFAFLIAYMIFLADFDGLPGFITRLYAFKYGDVLGHFILYGILASLLMLSFPENKFRLVNKPIPVAAGLLAVFIVLEEASQAFILTRTFSMLDLTASLTGFGLGCAVALWLAGRIGTRVV
jgi:VanZ family protein